MPLGDQIPVDETFQSLGDMVPLLFERLKDSGLHALPPSAGSVALIELSLTGRCPHPEVRHPPNGSGDWWHPNHGAELVGRICDREWLTRHFEA